jgi:hypothetical protein
MPLVPDSAKRNVHSRDAQLVKQKQTRNINQIMNTSIAKILKWGWLASMISVLWLVSAPSELAAAETITRPARDYFGGMLKEHFALLQTNVHATEQQAFSLADKESDDLVLVGLMRTKLEYMANLVAETNVLARMFQRRIAALESQIALSREDELLRDQAAEWDKRLESLRAQWTTLTNWPALLRAHVAWLDAKRETLALLFATADVNITPAHDIVIGSGISAMAQSVTLVQPMRQMELQKAYSLEQSRTVHIPEKVWITSRLAGKLDECHALMQPLNERFRAIDADLQRLRERIATIGK